MTPRHFLQARAAAQDITPSSSQFLYGYPHVPRMSTGVHDPLLSSALYLHDGRSRLLFITSDIIWVPRAITFAARARIAAATGIPADNILISATHAHSAPITDRLLFDEADPVVPSPDPAYLQQLEDAIVSAATRAAAAARPAELGLTRADAAGIGTNRHDPRGPGNLEVPVLAVRDAATHKPLALMFVCCMHPTVLHEDSTLTSADFPGFARRHLQRLLGSDCVVLHHTGPAGNQSPRHVVTSCTFPEAERLGSILGSAVQRSLSSITCTRDIDLSCRSASVELPVRQFPPVAQAKENLARALRRFQDLQASATPRAEIRTAECDLFGAEETVVLANAAACGRLAPLARSLLPAQVQLLRIGPWKFIGWPGEAFVEFGLDLRAHDPNAFLITLASGHLHGYVATQEAIDRNWYEGANSLFTNPQSGQLLLQASLSLL